VYRRNVQLEDLVTALFLAATLQVPTIQIGPLPDAGGLFLSPIGLTGLFGFKILGFTPNTDYGTPANSGKKLWAVTSNGLYQQASPPAGAWALLDANITTPGNDPTNYGVNLQLFGPQG